MRERVKPCHRDCWRLSRSFTIIPLKVTALRWSVKEQAVIRTSLTHPPLITYWAIVVGMIMWLNSHAKVGVDERLRVSILVSFKLSRGYSKAEDLSGGNLKWAKRRMTRLAWIWCRCLESSPLSGLPCMRASNLLSFSIQFNFARTILVGLRPKPSSCGTTPILYRKVRLQWPVTSFLIE